jgi:hydroxymethylpyrimidine/phosphomethylpyrimidine kinase
MREPTPTTPPIALSIAGSDSGGGAGIQADLQTMAAHGVFGTTAITAVTAQNTRGVEASHVLSADVVEAQYDAVVSDFDVGAIKTGMLATTPIVELVAERIADSDAPAVVDPVMVATSGDRLLEPDADAAYETLIGEATIVTPNADEAYVLTGVDVADVESAEAAGEAILDLGANAALVKGGHVESDPIRDVLVTREKTHVFEHERVNTNATHGSGCALSSAIAALLARGEPLPAAVETGTAFLERAVAHHYNVGQGPGAVNHLVDVRARIDGDMARTDGRE